MNVIVNIDFKQLGKDADLKIKKGLNEILKMLKEYALKESPIDT